MAMTDNRLFYGDNLEVLKQHVQSESVDLVYLDPPFNSNRSYNVIFSRHQVIENADSAQIQAFDDTWRWTPVTDEQYTRYVTTGELPSRVADALVAMRTLLGENDALAYLVNMAPRLVELHRVLKSTGSLYLHCDPTMSHYLKVMLDAIFGAENFRNEIIWQRTGSKGLSSRRLPNNHDVILAYQMSAKATWKTEAVFTPYDELNLDAKTAAKYSLSDSDGRLYELKDITNPNPDRPNLTYEFMGITKVWRWTKDRMQEAFEAGLIVQTAPGNVPRIKTYLDERKGKPFSDVWSDIAPLNSQAAERLGYPTQKPLALLDRIITLSTNPGDICLDPFAGCGTTIDSAQRLNRRWVGMDITYIAIDLIEKRLRHTYGDSITDTYDILGIPKDKAAALALFSHSPFDFERWAVSMINAQPNVKQVGDKGIDGVARFPVDGKGGIGRVLVSVKGGKQINPAMVRDLGGTVSTQKGEMGVLILLTQPTRGMTDEMNHAGTYTHPASKEVFPKIQIITVDELLKGKKPKMPPTILPYMQAQKAKATSVIEPLFDV
jgi:DNA modification methylase